VPITASCLDDSAEPDELSGVLQHVALDKLTVNRPRIANHPDTREFLEIGLQLLREDLIGYSGGPLDGVERCRLFEALSSKRIIDRSAANDNHRDSPLLLSVAKFRERWRHKNKYTEDLLAYLFRTAPQEAYMREVKAAVDGLIATVSLGDLVRQLAHAELKMVLADPLFELHAIIEVALPNHPGVQRFLRAQEESLLPAWAEVYERIGMAYGVTLAPDYTWHDVAVLFNHMINGILSAARSAGGRVPVLSNGDNILVGAIFAMLPALFGLSPGEVDQLHATG
jgi:hypothetical protein